MATTTNYGWETPDDTDLVKDGALAARTTASAIDTTLGTALNSKAYSGLVLVKSQAIGTGVSSVSVTNAFSATYDHYKIVIGGNCAGSTNLFLQLTLTGSSTNYASAVIYAPYTGGSPAAAGLGTSSWSQAGDVSTLGTSFNVELANPFNTTYTGFRHLGTGIATNGNALAINGVHGISSSYSGFTITTSAGTITGGTIYVYGYGKS